MPQPEDKPSIICDCQPRNELGHPLVCMSLSMHNPNCALRKSTRAPDRLTAIPARSTADEGWPHAEYTVPDIERRLRARTTIPVVQWAEGYRCGAIDERESGDLSLRVFRDANVARCEDVFFPLKSWSPTDYGCALAGEVGEACNLLKKMLRGDEVDLRAVEDELADAFGYLDLLAARLGIDLAKAVTRKFNQVSEEKGSSIRLLEVPRGS